MLIGKRVLYYGGHLLLFCSDPAEAQKVINKVATEKGVLYKPTESKEKRGEEYLFERSECFTLWPLGWGCSFKEGSLYKETYYFVRLPEDAVFGLVDGNLFQGGHL